MWESYRGKKKREEKNPRCKTEFKSKAVTSISISELVQENGEGYLPDYLTSCFHFKYLKYCGNQ